MTIYVCPDCRDVGRETAFETHEQLVAHREEGHPPSMKRLVPVGIQTQEVVHGQPREE